MSADELRANIENLLLDTVFSYNGIDGSICPFSRDRIGIMYAGNESVVHSIDELFAAPFIDGKSLNDICEEIDFG